MVASPAPWTIQKLITWTTGHFQAKQIESARLDAEVLLAHTLQCKRLDLYLNFDKPLKAEELNLFREYVRRRATREPVAYIVQEKEFYGYKFKVGPGVLIPRPETEHLVDEALGFLKSQVAASTEPPVESDSNNKKQFKILDVGCGSGCIGLSVLKEASKNEQMAIHATLLDASENAKLFSTQNALALEINPESFEIICEDFEKFASQNLNQFDLVISNPPYVARQHSPSLSIDVKDFEPEEALYGGDTGIELIEKWAESYASVLKPGGLLLVEIGFDQGDQIKKIFEGQKNLSAVEILKDYSNHDRILKARKV